MDTQGTQTMDTSQTQTQETQEQTQTQTQTQADFTWKSHLNPDFANSPTMQKYADTKEGFNDATKAHLELQKMMGYEKVPVPKGPEDKAAMDAFRKAFKIPDKAEGYNLADIEVPENMKDLNFDKKGFAEVVHKRNLTPDQAKSLWGDYTEMVKKQYADASKKYQDEVANAVTQLRSEWGSAYESKVELGQMVINKFSGDQATSDFVTAQLAKDPRGIKFLAKLGDQFAENKIGDFKYQRHSLTPDEIDRELSTIRSNPKHPYNDEKAYPADRDAAIKYVNSLIEAKSKTKTLV